MGLPKVEYLGEIVGALRPHFFFIPGGAALAGAAAVAGTPTWAGLAMASVAALGWGVGQLLNDLLDVEADAVDAPHRPGPRGRLPVGPTLAAAIVLGLGVLSVSLLAAPRGWPLIPLAVVLLVLYNRAKATPLLGNLAHGALVGVAAGLGASAQASAAPLGQVSSVSHGVWLYAGATAAIYLQANYEKDVTGDGRAGYRTLAHLIGVRASAALRTLAAAGVVALGWGSPWLESGQARLVAGLGVVAVLASGLQPLFSGRSSPRFAVYGLAVSGALLMMLAPAVGWLGWPGVGIVAAGLLLVAGAFRRQDNP